MPNIISEALLGQKNQFALYTDTTPGAVSGIIQLTSDSKVKVIGKHPNVLGFYFEGNLVNLEDSYTRFINTFHQFSSNLYEMVPSFNLHVDFMHDFSLKSYVEIQFLTADQLLK